MADPTHNFDQLVSNDRCVLRVAGESGMGLNSVGDMLAQALKEAGYYTFSYREFPSLIKGGYAFQQVDVSDHPVNAPARMTNLMICLSRLALHKYLPHVKNGGIVLYSFAKLDLAENELKLVKDRSLQLIEVPSIKLAFEAGGTYIMHNSVLNGLVWKLLGLDLSFLNETLKRVMSHKPEVIDQNLACLQKGYDYTIDLQNQLDFSFERHPEIESHAALTGNHAVALGAVAAGVRAYFAYPMSPSSSILSYLADTYHETGMFVKQIEDEIAVANMTIGVAHMGARSMCATSGGGFDLMTEAVSLAAMTEIPFVCVIAQRPGPATGLPTWTSGSDLNLAIYAAHGEFTRLVLAAGDVESCYRLTQVAQNLAEKYQIPVILLTDKQLAESLFLVEDLPEPLPIERHNVPDDQLDALKPSDRYEVTESGVSKRWFPGQSPATFNANSDEHLPDGSLTEDADTAQAQYDKRLRKANALLRELPEPTWHGPEKAELTLIGWGSTKTSVLDTLHIWNQQHPDQPVNYLHFEYMYPLRQETLQKLCQSDYKNSLVIIEQNTTGQFQKLIKQETGQDIIKHILTYDGRPFFVETVLTEIQKQFDSIKYTATLIN